MGNVYSFSRLQLYQTCPRRFYLKYALGMVEPPSEPAELGRAVHRVIQLAVSGHPNPVKTAMAEAALPLKEKDVKKLSDHYLKKHQANPHQRYEGHLIHPIGDRGAKFQGYIDLLEQGPLTAVVTDFKSGHVIYEPDDTMQLRMYAWLVSKIYGYEQVEARLWFLREAYKRCLKPVIYKAEDLMAGERWATMLIDEIETNLASVNMGLLEPLEAFPPKHGHACDHCPFAKECRPDLLHLPDQVDGDTVEEMAAKVLVIERVLELARTRLREYAQAHGEVRVGDEVFTFRPQQQWFFPMEETREALLGLNLDPDRFLKFDSTEMKKLWEKNLALELQQIGRVNTHHVFMHRKADTTA